jgi:hypothetical protein
LKVFINACAALGYRNDVMHFNFLPQKTCGAFFTLFAALPYQSPLNLRIIFAYLTKWIFSDGMQGVEVFERLVIRLAIPRNIEQ